MFEVIISNGIRDITLTFDTEESRKEMITAIENCIEKPNKHKSIFYSDKKSGIIFTTTFLQQSLINIPTNP